MLFKLKRAIKYVIGFAFCIVGMIVAFNGTINVSVNGGASHSDKALQYGIGTGLFLIGLAFVISATRDRNGGHLANRRSRSDIGSSNDPGLGSMRPETPARPAVLPAFEYRQDPNPDASPGAGGWRLPDEPF